MTGVIHIAGDRIQIGDRFLRQRCAWCGALLLDYDLAAVAVPVGQEGPPATWPLGGLVLVDGGMSASVDHTDGADLPEGACARLDPKVTR